MDEFGSIYVPYLDEGFYDTFVEGEDKESNLSVNVNAIGISKHVSQSLFPNEITKQMAQGFPFLQVGRRSVLSQTVNFICQLSTEHARNSINISFTA